MSRLNAVCLVAAGLVGSAVAHASAAVYSIDWMNLDPFVMNDFTSPQPSLPTGNTFFLPGVGNVRMDYTSPTTSFFSGFRGNTPAWISGGIISGPDTYNWSDAEDFRRTNFSGQGTSDQWSITYTFLDGPVAAGNLALGVQGLGRLDQVVPGNITTATVQQSGTFLGEFGVGGPFGPNQFSGGAGSFQLQNALPGSGAGGSPSFNTAWAVVRIDDTISSLTVNFDQIGNDGVGLNIGYIVPTPGAAALLGLAGLATSRRRRA